MTRLYSVKVHITGAVSIEVYADSPQHACTIAEERVDAIYTPLGATAGILKCQSDRESVTPIATRFDGSRA